MTDLQAALLYCGESLWSTALNGTPAGHRMHRWMTTLSPGNVVIEITTARDINDTERIGVLVEQGREWVAAYSEAPGGYWEEYTWIRTFDGRDVRWTNCQWVRIPVSRDEHQSARRAVAA